MRALIGRFILWLVAPELQRISSDATRRLDEAEKVPPAAAGADSSVLAAVAAVPHDRHGGLIEAISALRADLARLHETIRASGQDAA